MTSSSRSAQAGTSFGRLWGALALSQIGERFGLLGLPVVAITTLHASAREVGILTACLTACYLLVGLPAGAWVERWPKTSTLRWAALVRVVALAAVPALSLADRLELTHLYAVALVTSTASVFFNVASQSVVPLLVPDEGIEAANGHLESTAQLSAVGGPALAGLFFRLFSPPLVLVVDALAYLGCFSLLRPLRAQEPTADDAPSASLRADIFEGIRFVFRHRVLRRLCLSVGASNFFATIVMTLLPLLILRQLGLGPAVMGVVLSAGTVGGLLGALAVGRVRQRFSAGQAMSGGLLLAAASTAAFPIAAGVRPGGTVVSTGLIIVGEFGITLGAVVFNISQVSTRQRVTPRHLLARMNASVRFVVWGTMPFAALIAGLLASSVALGTAMWIGVVGSFVTTLPILGMDRVLALETLAEVADAQDPQHA